MSCNTIANWDSCFRISLDKCIPMHGQDQIGLEMSRGESNALKSHQEIDMYIKLVFHFCIL